MVGFPGQIGFKGDPGEPGILRITNQQVLPGDPGNSGYPGAKGEPGDLGNPGSFGARGEIGPKGRMVILKSVVFQIQIFVF